MTWRIDDKYTKALLHLNGPNNGTSFTDESGKTWTADAGSPIIATAQYKFNGSGLSLDGASSITTGASTDFYLDSSTWTIDFWVRFSNITANKGLVQYRDNNSNHWEVYKATGGTLTFSSTGGSSGYGFTGAWSPSTDTWYHVAISKDSSNAHRMFIDGSQIGTTYTSTGTVGNYATGILHLGRYRNDTGSSSWLNGYLDEFRFSKGIARWTANFTPPTRPYQPMLPIEIIV